MQAVDRFMANSKRSRGEVMKEQARGILKYVIDVTPPAGWNKNTEELTKGGKAKQRGEQKVERDIRKIMTPARKGQKIYPESIKSLHKRYRSTSDGNVHTNLARKGRAYRVSREELVSYIREKRKMVGFLASGWKAAADSLGVRLPAWITKHSGPGYAKIRANDNGIRVEFNNSVRYAGAIKDFSRRVKYAIEAQAKKMEKRIRFYEANRMKQSGFSR